MDNKNNKINKPEMNFYFVYSQNGGNNLVAEIALKGGYVYYLIESKKGILDKEFNPAINPIANILDYCGSADFVVNLINPKDVTSKKTFSILSNAMDNYFNKLQNNQSRELN